MERLAACILEHQHGPSAVVRELQRLHRPLPIQLILQGVFVSQAIEARARRVLGGWHNDQHGALVAIIAEAPASAEDALAVLPQNPRATVRIAVQRIQHHLSSSVRPRSRVGAHSSVSLADSTYLEAVRPSAVGICLISARSRTTISAARLPSPAIPLSARRTCSRSGGSVRSQFSPACAFMAAAAIASTISWICTL